MSRGDCVRLLSLKSPFLVLDARHQARVLLAGICGIICVWYSAHFSLFRHSITAGEMKDKENKEKNRFHGKSSPESVAHHAVFHDIFRVKNDIFLSLANRLVNDFSKLIALEHKIFGSFIDWGLSYTLFCKEGFPMIAMTPGDVGEKRHFARSLALIRL